VVVGLLLLTAGLLAGTGVASAHAVLDSTTPAAGSVLPALPNEITLTFGEAVVLPAGAVRVFGPDGVEVDDGRAGHVVGSGSTVRVGLRPARAEGSYTVAWRVVSADTHPVSGAFTFSVGHPSATAAAPPPVAGGSALVGVLYGVTRALAFGSFAVLVGALAFLLLCWPDGAGRPLVPRVAATGWAVLVVSTVGTLLLQGPYGDGLGLADVVEPGAVATTLSLPLGSALVARLLLLMLGVLYLGRLRHRLPTATAGARAGLTAVGAVLAVGLAATWSVSGHAAVGLQPWLALPADVAHLVAMATWLGGLVVLACALRPGRGCQGGPGAAALTRFSLVARYCVAVVVATGTYQSWRQLGSWTAFVDTDYGRVLLLKIVAVLALLGVAELSRRAVHGTSGARERSAAGGATAAGRAAPGRRTLARTVLAETGIAAVVLALTAVLVNAEPGRTAEPAAVAGQAGSSPTAPARTGPTEATVRYDTGGPGGRGTLDVRVEPGRIGPAGVLVTVHGPDGAVLDVPELRLALRLPARNLGPLQVPVTRTAPGRYRGDGEIPLAGEWQLALTVRTSDVDEVTVRTPVAVGR
jgi:copper transport protein